MIRLFIITFFCRSHSVANVVQHHLPLPVTTTQLPTVFIVSITCFFRSQSLSCRLCSLLVSPASSGHNHSVADCVHYYLLFVTVSFRLCSLSPFSIGHIQLLTLFISLGHIQLQNVLAITFFSRSHSVADCVEYYLLL